MRKSPPPLRLLPAFEASARHASFKKAATELSVTPSAISQQIKTLESLMDTELFRREPGGVNLTAAGADLQDLVSTLLKQYHTGYARLHQRQSSPVVRVSTMPQVAYELLIPALPAFQQNHPHIDLRIETSETLVEFDGDWVTAAVRVGSGHWPGLRSELLCELQVAAFASPELMRKVQPTSFADAQRFTLIHSRTHTDDWETVSKRMNLDFSGCKHLYFENYFSAIAAAENGLGVMLGLLPLTQNSLDAGRLEMLLDYRIPLDRACYLVYPPRQQENPAFIAVANWVRDVFEGLQASAL